MRLLFDQNLSPRLKEILRDLYPGSIHVRDIGLESADDITVWAYARDHDFVIASKDSDFRQLSSAFEHPPKVLWIRCGNCSTTEIASILRKHYNDLLAFYQDEQRAFFELKSSTPLITHRSCRWDHDRGASRPYSVEASGARHGRLAGDDHERCLRRPRGMYGHQCRRHTHPARRLADAAGGPGRHGCGVPELRADRGLASGGRAGHRRGDRRRGWLRHRRGSCRAAAGYGGVRCRAGPPRQWIACRTRAA